MRDFKGNFLVFAFVLILGIALQGVNSLNSPGIPQSVLLATPVGPNSGITTCQGLWNKVGYICNPSKLPAFINSQTANATNAVQKFEALIARLGAAKSAAGSNWYSIPVEGFITDRKVNVMQAKICADFKAKMRKNSLCPRCSKDFASYLIQGKSGLRFRMSEGSATK